MASFLSYTLYSGNTFFDHSSLVILATAEHQTLFSLAFTGFPIFQAYMNRALIWKHQQWSNLNFIITINQVLK